MNSGVSVLRLKRMLTSRGDAFFLHRDAKDGIGTGNGAFVVGDDEELGEAGEVAEHRVKVCVGEGMVDARGHFDMGGDQAGFLPSRQDFLHPGQHGLVFLPAPEQFRDVAEFLIQSLVPDGTLVVKTGRGLLP